jgi:hypothetical protein
METLTFDCQQHNVKEIETLTYGDSVFDF